jgi:hypothetical protein
MPADRQLVADVEALIATGRIEDLEVLLIAHSSLPGPRANLELVGAVAGAVGASPALVAPLIDWLARPSGPNEPDVFLPLVAAASLGALHAPASAAERRRIVASLRRAAGDERWRVREGVAMGLQRIGEHSFDELAAILRDWMTDATLLERRAIVAALAHPPVLTEPRAARQALEIAEPVAASLKALDKDARKSEAFRVLRQGLSYALSVLVMAAPEEGFAMLERLARSGDADLIRVVDANLGKPRLAKHFPAEVARLTTRPTS